jgi:hypothetical protein
MFHDSDRDGIYGHKVEEHLQWSDKAAQLIQGIASDTHMMERARMKNVDPMEVQSWLMQTVDVSRAKIEEISSFLVDEFKGTREGDQMFRALTQLEMNPSTGDLYTPEEAEKKMLSSLRDIGMKQRSSNFQYAGARFDPGQMQGPEKDMLSTATRIGPAGALEEITNPDKIRKALKDREKQEPEGKRINQKDGIAYNKPISMKVANLTEQLNAGLGADINWNEYSPADIAEWALTDPGWTAGDSDLRKAFPRDEGESGEKYAVRMAGVLGSFRNKVADKIPKNSQAAATMVRQGINIGKIILPDGNAAKDLNVWADANQRTFGFGHKTEANIIKALNNSVQAEMEDKAVVDGQAAGITTLVVSGKHAGAIRHTFLIDGNKYEILTEPYAYQGSAMAASRMIAEVRSSLSPTAKETVSIPGIGSFTVKNIPVTDTQGSRLETVLVDENTGEMLRGEDVENLNTRLFHQAAGSSKTIWQQATTFNAEPRERKP